MHQISLARRLSLLLGVAALVAAPAAFAGKAAPKSKMDTPTLACGTSTGASIQVTVTAGATGAPAGFSIQWMTLDEFTAYGWPADSDNPAAGSSFCKASFSGNANGSWYDLGPGESTTVQIGDTLYDDPGASSTCPSTPLNCGTAYVFRAFAHATSTLFRSDFTPDLTCSTIACAGGGCTYTQGYWKNHAGWPVKSLTLGTVPYPVGELQSILGAPAAGNGLISLAHQLIAAKLNVASGADGSAVAGAIAAADALIGGLVVPPVGSGVLAPSATSSLVVTLTSYNEGGIGPGHCQ